MTETEQIAALEKRLATLERQVLDMSELLGKQSNLIVTLSEQQTKASHLLSLVNDALREPASEPNT